MHFMHLCQPVCTSTIERNCQVLSCCALPGVAERCARVAGRYRVGEDPYESWLFRFLSAHLPRITGSLREISRKDRVSIEGSSPLCSEICVYVYIPTYTYIYIYMCLYICIWIYIYIYIYMNICIYIYMYVYIQICINICMYVCLYTYKCI